jgi:hypothetical protein
MTDLPLMWSKNGGPPQLLPDHDMTDDGFVRSLADAEGREALGWVAVSCPPKVSALQGKQQLRVMDLYGAVEASIEAGADVELKIYWANAIDWHRDHPKLIEMAAALGLDEAAADAFFVAAALIT